jgi:hypothetical protein
MINDENNDFTTQSSNEEKEGQLGDTTNILAQQLKEEGGNAISTEDNPDNIENPDDLHEIQAANDLDEPDKDSLQPTEENKIQVRS